MRRLPPWAWLMMALIFGATATFMAMGWLKSLSEKRAQQEKTTVVPVVVEAGGRGDGGDAPRFPAGGTDTLALEISGVRVVVPPGFDPDHLARVIAAIRAAS